MKRKRHTPEQIIAKLRDADAALTGGSNTEQICKQLEINPADLLIQTFGKNNLLTPFYLFHRTLLKKYEHADLRRHRMGISDVVPVALRLRPFQSRYSNL